MIDSSQRVRRCFTQMLATSIHSRSCCKTTAVYYFKIAKHLRTSDKKGTVVCLLILQAHLSFLCSQVCTVHTVK